MEAGKNYKKQQRSKMQTVLFHISMEKKSKPN